MNIFKNKLVLIILLVIPFLWANILNESFTGKKFPPEGWQIYNMDNGIVCWRRSPAKNYTPPACARCRFEKNNRRNDDWLVTPQLFPIPGNDTLKFYYRAHNKNFKESLEVWVSITGNRPENFYTRIDAFNFRNREYALRVIPLNQFDSIPIFIAFRNVGLFGVNSCYIDDVSGVRLINYDVGVINIIRPRKIEIPSQIYPKVTIKNFGTEAANNFSLEINIKNNNNQSVYYTIINNLSLAAKETLTIETSTPWNATVGEYIVIAKTIFSLDKNPYNNELTKNVSVYQSDYHDVGIKEIIYPVGYVPQGGVIPVGLFENCGNCDEQFFAICEIYLENQIVYSDTISVTMEKFSEREISFDPFTVGENDYKIVMKAVLANDMDLNNNEKFEYFYSDNDFAASFRDVGIIEIIQPIGEYESDVSVTPQIKVKNYSYHTETFKITLKITDSLGQLFYLQEKMVYALGENEERIITFPTFNVEEGNFTVKSYLHNIYDQNPANDTLLGTFRGRPRFRDVGITEIIQPIGEYETDILISPQVKVKNYTNYIETFKITFNIKNSQNEIIYSQEDTVYALGQNEERIITFPTFRVEEGDFNVLTYLNNIYDRNPANDTLVGTFSGKKPYTPPPGFSGWVLRRDMPILEHSPYRIGSGGALTFINDYIYATKGSNTFEFYRYNPRLDKWYKETDIPKGEKNKGVKGGALTSGNNKIYLLKGNKTNELYAYDLETKVWERLRDIPIGKIKEGASIVYLENDNGKFLYLTIGGGSDKFLKYDIEKDTFILLKNIPKGNINKGAIKGSALLNFQNQYLYFLKGKSNEFYLYNIALDSWEIKEPMPFFFTPNATKKKTVGPGASLTTDNEKYIYAFKGNNTTEFYLYNTETNEWIALEPIPTEPFNKKVKDGGSLVHANGWIYALKGNKTLELWLFIPPQEIYSIKKKEEKKGVTSLNTISFRELKQKNISIYNAIGKRIEKRIERGVYFLIQEGKKVKKIILY
ncbi:MAG: choice-of-anchor J domain-containing protein [candidate division WOR-3 bacterium]|nr:choice-of-anchor J domain-containing protein [candidate division WOR-3 bacterium]